ncbi:MAG: hypothetical protein IJZ39_00305 [Oscillospiraceae bacterium]|nr:hypothetical protein [Oscillospiraceae bacterium]
MLNPLLEKLSLFGLDRMPDVGMRKILLGFVLIPAVQISSLIAGVTAIWLSDGWAYVWIIFIQTILTIIAGIVLCNLRDAYLNRYYHSQFLETLHWGRGSNMAPVLREARRRGDRDTRLCIRLTPVPMFTTMIVNLILIGVSTVVH